jgi:hypothetical protein
MRVRAATLAAAVVLAALLINHGWVSFQTGRIAAAANVGVALPGHLRFLVKLDHFAVDYGYVLIPFAWAAVFVVTSVVLGLRNLLWRSKPAGSPSDWPAEP